MTGSNRRPPACKAGALPAELIPQCLMDGMVGLVGLEPTTPALSRRCSNQLSYRPFTFAVTVERKRNISRVPRHAAVACPASSLSHTVCSTTADKCGRPNLSAIFQKGGDPAAPSDTATLLRLHPSHEPCRGNRPPCG
jgi:hypothetical protein